MDSIDLIRFLEEFLGVPKQSWSTTDGWYSFDCPKCREDYGDFGKHNLEVNIYEQYCHCWKCGYSGKLYNLTKDFAQHGKIQELSKIVKNLLIPNTYKKNFITLPDEFIPITTTTDNKFTKYLLSRGIPCEKAVSLNIGYCDDGQYGDSVVFPSYDKNRNFNGFVTRNVQKSEHIIRKQDHATFIFNEHLINWESNLFITEGVFDSLSMYNCSPLLGKFISNYFCKRIAQSNLSSVTFLMDNDVREEELMRDAKKLALYWKSGDIWICKTILKDLNKTFVEQGQQGILECLNHKKRYKPSNDYEYEC